MINKKGLKRWIKKLMLTYLIFIPLPITFYIVAFVFPQVPMMTLGHQYNVDPFYSNDISSINVRFSNQSTYLSFIDRNGLYTYRSDDDGFNWVDLMNGSFSPGVINLRMDVYNDTIGILYQNSFIYSGNQGCTWSAPRSIPRSFNAIAFINSTYIIGCSDNWTFTLPDYNSTIYISRDLGLHWEIQSIIPSYIQQSHRYTVRVTQNQTIYMYGLSSNIIDMYSIYRSADFGKTWTEIETDFSGGWLLMGDDNIFYIFDEMGKLYKSTDECITWAYVEVTEINRKDMSTPTLEINENDEIFVIYTKMLPKFSIIQYPLEGLDYFWVGCDIWTGRYVLYFFTFFLPAAGIGFLVILAIYSLYTVIKRDNPRNRTKTQV